LNNTKAESFVFEFIFTATFCFSVSGPVKALILDFLLHQTKLKKQIPLSLEQRFSLVEQLLNPRLKKFDFAVLDPPKDLYDSDYDEIETWNEDFDYIWDLLVAKCPNLEFLREKRATTFGNFEHAPLNPNIFSFSQLTYFASNCAITSGNLIINVEISR